MHSVRSSLNCSAEIRHRGAFDDAVVKMVCAIAGAKSYVFEMCKSMKAAGLAMLTKGW
jgi:hypothetical protein